MHKNIPLLKLNIRSQTDKEAVIDIDGEIGWATDDGENLIWNTKEAIKKQLKEISAMKVERIIVNISSLGGYVDDGLAIHDLLASHKAEVITNVIGFTASAATLIAQAGNIRKISDNALYLIHKSIWVAIGNENDIEQTLRDMKVIDEKLANIYAKRSGQDIQRIKGLMNENQGDGIWLNAQEAKSYGLVDEVYEPLEAAASATIPDFSKYGLPIPKNIKIDNMNEDKIETQEVKEFSEEQKNWFKTAFDNIEKLIKGDKEPEKQEEEEPELEPLNAVDEVKAQLIEKEKELDSVKSERDVLKEENEGLKTKVQELENITKEAETQLNELKNKVFGEAPEDKPAKQVFHQEEDDLPLVNWFKKINTDN